MISDLPKGKLAAPPFDAATVPVGWVYDARFLRHSGGPDHPESPERLSTVRDALDESALLGRMHPLPFSAVAPEELLGIHQPAYISLVRLACRRGMAFIGSQETKINAASYDSALLAVGAVHAACDAAMHGSVKRSFCAVRPPGHHAEPDLGGGFCLFNSVAAGADRLIRKHGLKRVAVVDFDVHHGNGTQKIFESRRDVLFISLHEHPAFLYPHSGLETEVGQGDGRGYTVNIPMQPGSDDSAYRQAFAKIVLPRLHDFKPEFLLLSAGFDAVREEQVAHINLEPESYKWMTEELVNVADQHCQGRLVSVLEGGYHLPSLGRSVVHHVRALMNVDTRPRVLQSRINAAPVAASAPA